MRKGDTIELQIDRMAFGGQGIARLDGRVIFVKGAVPGDRARALILRNKKAYAEAKIQELLVPSSDRIEAPCPYFGFCGGCQWQHVKYERQLEFKRGHVEEALSHIGSLSGIEVLDPIPSEKKFGYRNKMEFSFSDRPWLPNPPLSKAGCEEIGSTDPHVIPVKAGNRSDVKTAIRPPLHGQRGGFALGLHVPGTFDKIIDVEACLLQQERGNEILREVKRFARESGLRPYGIKSHEGFWRFLTLRHSSYHDEWMVNLVTSENRAKALAPLAQDLTTRFPNVKTVLNNITSRKASIAVGEKEEVLAGAGTIQDRIGSSVFQISANSFFQTNTLGAERLYGKVVEFAELAGRETVLDLYSGTGTIPIFLARSAKRVIGMEIAESAVADARRNCEANGIDNCDFILGDIRENLSLVRIHPEVMVIDPPRAGMHQDVLSRVLEIGAKRIVYVSCNPATLARDLGLMQEHYHTLEIQPVDMFPHTYHVESVAKLEKKNS
ncbi:MAG: 23S rRNA (uracil(1939)-C(5))-methyltransferase RlmD [Desulfobacterota bacterium]|jgi:23S rRNA (uracil1939-C5)-methyltransferase|nr:23S rRNA (uracil(1939)-C(5))-methyltransferase RlmD [Thermodesulfobacteriota bacterium]